MPRKKAATGFEAEHRLVKVRWLDTILINRWTSLEDAQAIRPSENISVGWIIEEDESHLTIAASWDIENNNVANCDSFPKVNVISVEDLALKRKT